jgi:flagellar protein FlaG
MATQIIGNYAGISPQPVPVQGESPRTAAPVRAAVPAQVSQQANLPPEQPTREQVQKAIEEVRKSVSQSVSNNLQFSMDEDTGKTIVRVTDVQTGELIRQIPSQEMVELAKALDRMQGALLRQEA